MYKYKQLHTILAKSELVPYEQEPHMWIEPKKQNMLPVKLSTFDDKNKKIKL